MAIKFKIFSLVLLMLFSSCTILDSAKKKIKISERTKVVLDLYKKNNNYEIINVTEDIVESIDYPVIEVRTNGIAKQLLMLQITQRGHYKNYLSGEGRSLTLNKSVISKTNGFDVGLLSVELEKNSLLTKSNPFGPWNSSETKKYSFIKKEAFL